MKALFIIESPKKKSIYLTQLQPLGVLYIASFLESKGISTDVIDLNVEKRKNIEYKKYKIIGYSINSGNIENTLESVKNIKNISPSSKILLGGPLVQLIPEKLILEKNIDALIDGEAEDIIYNYIRKKNEEEVLGLWIKKNKKPYFTGKKKPIGNLDLLPFPDLKKVPYKKYKVVLKKKSPVAGIITSRGCPFRCIFCHHSLGFKFRARSPENVIEEIKQNAKLGIKEFWIADDNFSMDMKRVERICDLVIKNNLNLNFSLANGIRVDKLNNNLIKKLKKAGFWLLTIAPESGSDKSLKKINKNFTLNQVENVVRMCKKNNIKTMSNFIIGFPWENEKDILKTIDFAKKIDTDITHFSRLIPYPGTPLWNIVKSKNYELKDESHNYGGLRYEHPIIKDEKFNQLIKKAYRETMLRPEKIFNLSKILRIEDLIKLGLYSIKTKNI